MTFCVNILTPNPHDILSPSVQNELLNICGIIIRDTVVTTCNNAQYFTVLAYDTTDKSAKEQGYDGAANMSAQYKGVQARIQRFQPQATYVLCKAQCLNLAIVLACKDAAITNVMDNIQDIAFVLTLNAKKSSWHSRRTSKKLRLQRRWVEKQSYNNCLIPDGLREQTV